MFIPRLSVPGPRGRAYRGDKSSARDVSVRRAPASVLILAKG